MNKGVRLTAIVLILLGALLVAYDFWVGATYGARATISEVVWYASRNYPIIPFGGGLLAGHFWTQMDTKPL